MAVTLGAAGTLVVQASGANNAPNAPGTVINTDVLLEFLSVSSNVTQTATASPAFTGRTQENAPARPALFMASRAADGTEDGTACSMACGTSLSDSSGIVLALTGAARVGSPVAQYNTADAAATTTLPAVALTSVAATSYMLWVACTTVAKTLASGPAGYTRLTANVSSTLHIFGKATPSASESIAAMTSAYSGGTGNRTALYEIKAQPASASDGNVVRSGVRVPITASVVRSGVRVPATVSVVRSGVRVPVV